MLLRRSMSSAVQRRAAALGSDAATDDGPGHRPAASVALLQLFFLTALLLPENVGEHENNREHFLARRHWFFGFLALFYVLDFAESWLKGVAYLQALGPMYPVRTVLYVGGCLLAIWTRSPVFHAVLAVVALAYQLLWLVRMNAFVFYP